MHCYSRSGVETRMQQLQCVLEKATSLVECHHSQEIVTSVLHDVNTHSWSDDDNEFREVNSR